MKIDFKIVVAALVMIFMTNVCYAYQPVVKKEFVDFCNRNPDQCISSSIEKIEYSKTLVNDLLLINRTINKQIRYTSDKKDEWNFNKFEGDCEDYALTKRARLVELGYPIGALRIAVVKPANAALHAVLVVVTDKGAYVLDNMYQTIYKSNEIWQMWVSVSSNDPMVWLDPDEVVDWRKPL